MKVNNFKGFDDTNIDNDFNPCKNKEVAEKPAFLMLSDEEKALIEILTELDIDKETQISIGLLFNKHNISIINFIEKLKKYNKDEINESKIIEIALEMRK